LTRLNGGTGSPPRRAHPGSRVEGIPG
jgi:hypothetical protein